MWRSTRTGMVVAAVATVLLVSGHLRGGDDTVIQIEYVRVDGAEPIRAGIQRFAAHLPPSQTLPD